MKKRQLISTTAAAVAMLILILDSKTAMAGAKDGIDLCIRTLIPSLFPFLVVSTVLTRSLMGQSLRILRPIGKVCGIPRGAESLLAVGLLGGYPVGAGNIAESYRSGSISREDAERMLSFCNNAGPSFLFGIIGPMFSNGIIPWVLWGIHMISAVAVGILMSGPKKASAVSKPSEGISLPKALEASIRTMAVICGWVILFRMILTFLDWWILWALSASAQVTVAGLLELSNGCVQLGQVECEGLRFLIAGTILSLGGVCVAMQTVSVTKGLSLRFYIPGKLLQSGISFLLCVLLQGIFTDSHQYHAPAPLVCIAGLETLLVAVVLRGNKKRSSIPALIGV